MFRDSIGTATMKVREADTSIAYKTGTVNTLSSAVLLALMEEACVNALDLPNLVCHNSSVAYGIQMKHIRPSPVGATLTATAKIKNIDLRGVHFDIEAFDEAGLVGKGIHTRVFVQQDEFERKCYDKARNLLLN